MMNNLLFPIWIVIVFNIGTFPQENNFLDSNTFSSNNYITENSILTQIEIGFKVGDVSKISKFFGAKPYLSLSTESGAYYSANQAYYVMEDFFKEFTVVLFEFSNKKIEKSLLYATGTYYFEKKGKRASSIVYVTLNKIGHNWKITQISIN